MISQLIGLISAMILSFSIGYYAGTLETKIKIKKGEIK